MWSREDMRRVGSALRGAREMINTAIALHEKARRTGRPEDVERAQQALAELTALYGRGVAAALVANSHAAHE